MKKTNYTFKSNYYKNLFNTYLEEESNCSFNGKEVLITGSTKNLNRYGFALTYPITVDEFMFLKHNKKVKRLGLDHSNDYEFKKDRNGHTWKTSPACYICNSQGEEIHAYVKTVLKEFSGKRKWSN
jgi:hypothetical protein